MVFAVLQIRCGAMVLKAWYGCVVNDSSTVVDVFNSFSSGVIDGGAAISEEYVATAVSAFIGRTKTSLTRVGSECPIAEAVSALGHFVEFQVTQATDIDSETHTAGSLSGRANAFSLLMQGAQDKVHLPDKWRIESPNKKLELKNHLIDWLQKNKLGWESSYAKELGVAFVNTLANTLWFVDGNHRTLADRGHGVPPLFESFQGYNKPELNKKRKLDHTKLNAGDLHVYSGSLFTLAGNSYMKRQQWLGVREAVLRLADNLRKHASYLEQQNVAVQECQAKRMCRSDMDDFDVLPACSSIKPTFAARYGSLQSAILHANDFEPILVEDHSPSCPKQRYNYNQGMVVPVKCVKYSYTGSRNHLHFVWKSPENLTEAENLKKNMAIAQELRKKLPTYHTRAMRREFIDSFGRFTSSKPAFLREAYRRLTGDASAASTTEQDEVDKRIAKLLDTEDPELIWDLRVQNSGRPESYTVFLEECQHYLESSVETAVDERRHDPVADGGEVITHLARALSVRDLYDQVCKKCPEGTPLPSIQWLR